MRLIFKDALLVVIPDDDADLRGLDHFADGREGHLLRLSRSGRGMQLGDLGEEPVVRNLPINITSHSPPPLDVISNLAHTPFTLDGMQYASIEGFWQSLKFADSVERRRVGALSGKEAKLASAGADVGETFEYGGEIVRVGTYGHWSLMRRACREKFTQHDAAREALLSTGDRPLVHRVRRDSRIIPGVIMADIWMSVRARLRKQVEGPNLDNAGTAEE